MTVDRAPLLDALGVDLPDELLTLALTHRSYAYEHGGLPTNERLEFLGDAVLGLTITDELFHQHPDRSEGDLAKLRASVVNTQALADVGAGSDRRRPGRASAARPRRGEHRRRATSPASWPTAWNRCSARSTSQHGIDGAREVILRLFGRLLDTAPTLGAGLDWKTSLQELTAARGLGVPSYVVTSTGPDHDKEFTATVVVTDIEYGRGRPHQEGSRAEGRRSGLERRSTVPTRATDRDARTSRGRGRPARTGTPTSSARPSPRSGCTIPRAVRRHEAGPADLTARLLGARITGTGRRGKYLWLDRSDERRWRLVVHLGHERADAARDGAERPNHLRIAALLDDGTALSFVDQRTFGGWLLADLVTVDGSVVPEPVAHIARDPLDPLFDRDAVVKVLRRKHSEIKRQLLDQTVVSGIGNIYADEALWRAKVNGARLAETLTRPTARSSCSTPPPR